MNKETVKYSFKASLPVCAGYIVLGIGFGLLLYDKGYSFLWALGMSFTIYAGSLQFVGVSLLSEQAPLLTVALTSLVINLRHLFYGISMLDEYKAAGKRRFYLIFALTDETYSLVCSPSLPPDVDKNGYYFFVSLFNHIYWITGSVLGGLIGSLIPFSTAGIDFSMTALFVVVAVEQWEKAENHWPAIIGLVVSIASLLIVGPENFLIPAMILITILLFALKKVIQK